MSFIDKDPKLVKVCEVCNREFNITRIRHKCKRCLRRICYDCGKSKIKVVTHDFNNFHRVCTICFSEHEFQQELSINNQVSWGNQSTVARKWMECSRAKECVAKCKSECYDDYLKMANDPNTVHNDFTIIKRDVLDGRSNRNTFNYSMQDYLYYNQVNVQNDKTKQMISNVLKAYCMKFPNYGYTQGMSYMAVFLLSLMDEESAFWIFSFIITSLMPKNFYASVKQGIPLMGYQQEKYVIWELATQILNLDTEMSMKVQSFLEINGPALLIPCFVNYLNFQILYSTWNQMIISRSLSIFKKVTIKIIELLLPMIENSPIVNPPDAQAMILRIFNIDQFWDAQTIEIQDRRVKELEEKFKSDYSLKWMSNETYIYHSLQKATHFNKVEIKQLQEKFTSYVMPQSQDQDEIYSPKHACGIKKEEFKMIIAEVISTDEDKKDFLRSFDLEKMFDVFDIDRTGVLDFKEFLFSLSMLMRGGVEEKIQFAFQVFDDNEKGFLSRTEYEGFVKSIVQAAIISNQGNTNPFFQEDLKKFEDKMYTLIDSRESLSFMDIKKDVLTHKFIKYCGVTEQARKRGQTIAKIAMSLNEDFKNYKEGSRSNRMSIISENMSVDGADDVDEMEKSTMSRYGDSLDSDPISYVNRGRSIGSDSVSSPLYGMSRRGNSVEDYDLNSFNINRMNTEIKQLDEIANVDEEAASDNKKNMEPEKTAEQEGPEAEESNNTQKQQQEKIVEQEIITEREEPETKESNKDQEQQQQEMTVQQEKLEAETSNNHQEQEQKEIVEQKKLEAGESTNYQEQKAMEPINHIATLDEANTKKETAAEEEKIEEAVVAKNEKDILVDETHCSDEDDSRGMRSSTFFNADLVTNVKKRREPGIVKVKGKVIVTAIDGSQTVHRPQDKNLAKMNVNENDSCNVCSIF